MRALVYQGPGQRGPDRADASSAPALMRLAAAGQLDAARFVTHRMGMNDFERAYDLFGDAAGNGALKVILTRQEEEEDELLEETPGRRGISTC
jgi:threonine dehydrogenase-like Zn-dependent dehydrogenase